MIARPKLRLSRLRDIGWALWDPIGLNDFQGDWSQVSYADEYDSYLIKVAGMLRNERSIREAVDYLVRIETEHMGLSLSPLTRERALLVVQTINSDSMIWREQIS